MKTDSETTGSASRSYRKPNRLTGYDYAAYGYYFITICTARHELLFGQICPDDGQEALASMHLNELGRIVEQAIRSIPQHYPHVAVDKYVVMPNHIHLILAITISSGGKASISTVVQQLKRAVTVQFGRSIWQQGFYDHIIRGDTDYREIWTYIDNNPAKWALDKYYHEI